MADRLPYPHARNDCEMCRERDADFAVTLDDPVMPRRRPSLLFPGRPVAGGRRRGGGRGWLDASFSVFSRGDKETCDRLVAEAFELDANVVAAVQGGMMIGEIPRPEEHPAEWREYILANRDGLAEMEAEES